MSSTFKYLITGLLAAISVVTIGANIVVCQGQAGVGLDRFGNTATCIDPEWMKPTSNVVILWSLPETRLVLTAPTMWLRSQSLTMAVCPFVLCAIWILSPRRPVGLGNVVTFLTYLLIPLLAAIVLNCLSVLFHFALSGKPDYLSLMYWWYWSNIGLLAIAFSVLSFRIAKCCTSLSVPLCVGQDERKSESRGKWPAVILAVVTSLLSGAAYHSGGQLAKSVSSMPNMSSKADFSGRGDESEMFPHETDGYETAYRP